MWWRLENSCPIGELQLLLALFHWWLVRFVFPILTLFYFHSYKNTNHSYHSNHSRPDSANEKLQCVTILMTSSVFKKRYFYACIRSGDPSFSGLEIWRSSSRENKVNFTVDVVIAGQKLLLRLLHNYVPQYLMFHPFWKKHS